MDIKKHWGGGAEIHFDDLSEVIVWPSGKLVAWAPWAEYGSLWQGGLMEDSLYRGTGGNMSLEYIRDIQGKQARRFVPAVADVYHLMAQGNISQDIAVLALGGQP